MDGETPPPVDAATGTTSADATADSPSADGTADGPILDGSGTQASETDASDAPDDASAD